MDNKWAQEKINTAYKQLELCITCTPQKQTRQNYFDINTCTDLGTSFRCPPINNEYKIFGTNLCSHTIQQIGTIKQNGTVIFCSSCSYNAKCNIYTFCEESRCILTNGKRCINDYVCTIDYCCPYIYCNCLWTGTDKQFQCRQKESALCKKTWNNSVVQYNSLYNNCCCTDDKDYYKNLLSVCKNCYGNWTLSYPCFCELQWCNVSKSTVCSLAYLYQDINGYCLKPDDYSYCSEIEECVPNYVNATISNSNSQRLINNAYTYTGTPLCIGAEPPYLYRFGNESQISCFTTVPCDYLMAVCRTVDIYTVSTMNR